MKNEAMCSTKNKIKITILFFLKNVMNFVFEKTFPL